MLLSKTTSSTTPIATFSCREALGNWQTMPCLTQNNTGQAMFSDLAPKCETPNCFTMVLSFPREQALPRLLPTMALCISAQTEMPLLLCMFWLAEAGNLWHHGNRNTMKLFIVIFFLISGLAYGQTNFRAVMADTNGVVQRPTNFLTANQNTLYGTNQRPLLFNSTNGQITYTNTNTLTFTNTISFLTNIVASVRTNLQLGGGITINITFIDAATNTNTVSISNGIITGWTQ